MVFIVYSEVSEKKLSGSLGMPEYSYYFVLRGFVPVLRELGRVIPVQNPEKDVDAIYDDCLRKGEQCVFLSFSPPNKSAVGLRCPTLCVFAWEFDRIPDEVWDNDPKNDWRNVLADHGRAITLSQYSADAVKRAMGPDFPVASIPVPVWDAYEHCSDRYASFPAGVTDMTITGNIIDSRNYEILPDAFDILNSTDGFNFLPWPGGTLRMRFTQTDDFSQSLGGFYEPEPWGTWSRIEKPWVLLPYLFAGEVRIKIRLDGYAGNANREITVALGSQEKKIILKDGWTESEVTFFVLSPHNVLKFSGLDLSPVSNARDARTMGIGLHWLEISTNRAEVEPGREASGMAVPRRTQIDGIVYTSVFNPADDRKNWMEMVKAFCMAFRDTQDATLVLKMTHHSLSSFMGKLHFLFQTMWPFRCRIVALHGYLADADYEKLIAATSVYVNAARCEGLCLPLMEFMSCATPSIAPCHTSLADYVDASSTWIVNSGIEPGIWPHDPRNVFRALRYRIDWESLRDAYRQSYETIKHDPEAYRAMGEAARAKMKAYASNAAVKKLLKDFFSIKDYA